MTRDERERLDPHFCNMFFGASQRHWLRLRRLARRYALV